MNQAKIGKFIADERKLNNLTQSALAEKLGVSDRAVSKWENGKCLPDASIMLDLCKILKITVNDLLHGERVCMENYNKELEQTVIELTKAKEQADKRLLKLEIVIGVLSCIILFVPIFIGALLPSLEDWQRLLIVFSGFIPAIVGFSYAMKLEQVAGYYECKLCKHKYIPKLKEMYGAMHMGRTRYLKCPNCNKKSWQKKVISKD